MSMIEEKTTHINNGEFDIESEEVEEKEEVDLELQQAMKNLKLEEDIFKLQKDKPKPEESKISKENKKGKKNKGEDFLDYAMKNGINMNITYEEKSNLKDDKKNVGNYQRGKGKSKHINKNNSNGELGPKLSPNEDFKNQNQKTYYKNGNNYKKPSYQKKNFHKTGSNKFDFCNQHLSSVMPFMQPLYNPFILHSGINPQQYYSAMNPYVSMNTQVTPQYLTIPDLLESSDKAILDFLEIYLSLQNLNQDLYLRNRIDEEGYIEGSEIVKHNKLKRRGVNLEQLTILLEGNKEHPIIQTAVNEEGKVFLRNRDWDNIKDKLSSIEYIQQQKIMMKNNIYMNSMNTINYVNMQNNYYYNPSINNEISGMNPMYNGYQYNTMDMKNNVIYQNETSTNENMKENEVTEN